MLTKSHREQVAQELIDGADAVLQLDVQTIAPDLGQALAKLLRSSAVYAKLVGDEPTTVKDALAIARAVTAAGHATEK
ncbi:hypothetical protein HZZ00_37625 (plasmid) [Streptomyces sp. NEAU-sy36]|uniref:hypothetical protein n=1 Tax=unclassified Streptomyces TaxID=2593676 RepID=UPI0015D61707|nr:MULTISPECIES: hypothetical protein [unclassified Streptomyces]QLJ06754.1 hypothetical protein HZZ00_37625 [Streptomyces sp. NEAU-sy36]